MRYLNLLRNVENWHDYLLYKLGITRNDPLVFHCRSNVVATVPRRLLHTFKEIFLEECYTKYIPKDLIVDGITVVDIGANAGYFSLFMLSRYPHARILAFEPIPRNFELLAHHREQNSVHNFAIADKAVSGKRGKITLRYDAADSYTTAASMYENELGQDKIDVCAITLDEIFETYSVKQIDLLKLDCEGAEYQILYNCPGQYMKSVICIALESHDGGRENENKASMVSFLGLSGYNVRTDKGGMVWAWRDKDG